MAYNDQNKSGYPYPPPQYTPNPVPMQPEPHPLPPVITQQPVHIVHIQAPPSVGPSPSMIVCPACRSNVMTRVELESSTRTHLMALGLCLLGCWPCVCIPYCVDSCQSANHYCPNCSNFIGTYQG